MPRSMPYRKSVGSMSTPVWVLLGFAGWTALLLLSTIGVYRWKRVLTREAGIADFKADQPSGDDWYLRAMRAHANCIENLPLYGAVVVAMMASGGSSPVLDALALVLLPARMAQSVMHVFFKQTNRVVAIRFT